MKKIIIFVILLGIGIGGGYMWGAGNTGMELQGNVIHNRDGSRTVILEEKTNEGTITTVTTTRHQERPNGMLTIFTEKTTFHTINGIRTKVTYERSEETYEETRYGLRIFTSRTMNDYSSDGSLIVRTIHQQDTLDGVLTSSGLEQYGPNRNGELVLKRSRREEIDGNQKIIYEDVDGDGKFDRITRYEEQEDGRTAWVQYGVKNGIVDEKTIVDAGVWQPTSPLPSSLNQPTSPSEPYKTNGTGETSW